MFQYIWPLGLVVISNVIYHICSKSVPEGLNPFASLTITYLVAAAVSCGFYYVFNKGGSLLQEFKALNWAPFILGLVVVGLEVGFIYAYKAGWQISTAAIVQSVFLAVVLIAVGFLLFREALTWNKLVGVVICLIGLVFINLK